MSGRLPANLGRADRLGRVILGLVLLGFALACPFAARQGAAVVWGSGLVGAALVASAAAGRCPLYGLLGLSSRRS